MPINFPDTPTVNQIFSAGSLQYRWTGAVWADNLTASITYDAVTNKPTTFPPSAHTHLLSQITDYVEPEITFTNTFMTMGA